MFNKLFELEKQRTASEAFGFYIAYCGVGLLLAAILSFVLGGGAGGTYETFDEGFNRGLPIGANFAVVFSLVLTAAVAYKKSAGFNGMVLTLVAGAGSILLGLFVGVIPAAFLTTRPPARLSNSTTDVT